MNRKSLCAGLAIAAVVGGVAAAAPANAAQQLQPLDCGSAGQLVLRTNTNNSSDMGGWGAAQVVSGGSGHLIPTSFTFSAFDNTTQQSIFSGTAVKGSGNANHNQPTVSCSSAQTATLADLLDPGEQPPPGTSLTDSVTFTITATAVVKS